MELWIARDYGDNADLCLYSSKPYQVVAGIWTCYNQDYIFIDNKLFPEVTFENSPKKIELNLLE